MPTSRPVRSAFTLLEMILALALATVVLSSMQTLIFMATKAVPEENGAQAAAIESADGIERFLAEVSVAVEVLDYNDKAMTFSVADWTGDDVVETIKYAWSGTSGDPLLRAVNGGDALELISSVDSFVLSATQGTENETIETEVVTEDHLAHEVDVGGTSYLSIADDYHICQTVVPDLPAGATSWVIDAVELWPLARVGSGPDLLVEIRDYDWDTNTPGNTVFAEGEIRFSQLGYYWLTECLAPMTSREIPADQDVCIYIYPESSYSGYSAFAGVHCGGIHSSQTQGRRVTQLSNNAGSSWITYSSYVVDSEIYATVTSTTSVVNTRDELASIRVTVGAGDPLIELDRTVRLLNVPEVLP